ncbi:MAG: hypothetical protein WCJ84_05520 [Candidatus Peregrinibacteria bacterium]
MISLLSQIFLRLTAYAMAIGAFVGVLFFASPYFTQYFGFSGITFLEPSPGAYDLRYLPALFVSVPSPVFLKSDLLVFVGYVLTTETAFWSAVFIRQIFVTRFSDSAD